MLYVIPTEVEESLTVPVLANAVSTEILRDVSTSLDMTGRRRARDRGPHRFRFVHAFVKFTSRIGVGAHPRAGLDIRLSVFQNDRTNRNATIMRSIESEVTDDSRVKSAPRFFQFGNDLHRPNLGRAGNGDGRKRGSNRVENSLVFAQPRDDVRDDVHHVAVTLDHHLLSDFDAAEFCNTAEIVSAEVDQHHVLGALLWIGN